MNPAPSFHSGILFTRKDRVIQVALMIILKDNMNINIGEGAG